MALNGKYRSSHEVIEEVKRDFGFPDLDIYDAVAWIGEALELIGESPMFIDKQTDGNFDLGHEPVVEIKNGRAKIPCDLVRLKAVKDYETGRTLIASFDHFMPTFEKDKCDCGTKTNEHHKDCSMLRPKQQPEYQKTYRLDNNFMFFNFEKGHVILSYIGLALDENGFPKIPDDVSFMSACKYHVAYKYAMKLWIQNKINGQVYKDLEQNRDFYIGQAAMRAILPSEDELEAIRKMWVRLIPNVNRHEDGFKAATVEEQFGTTSYRRITNNGIGY